LFYVLWSSAATASLPGFIVGTFWHVRRRERRSRIAKFLLSFLLLAGSVGFLYAMVLERPSMRAMDSQLRAIRSLAQERIVQIDILTPTGRAVHVKEPQAVSAAQRCFQQAMFAFHVPTVDGERCEMRIITDGESFKCAVEQEEASRRDEIYTFRAYHVSAHIRIPELHDWLEEWAMPVSSPGAR
jgi:hypothetical protein